MLDDNNNRESLVTMVNPYLVRAQRTASLNLFVLGLTVWALLIFTAVEKEDKLLSRSTRPNRLATATPIPILQQQQQQQQQQKQQQQQHVDSWTPKWIGKGQYDQDRDQDQHQDDFAATVPKEWQSILMEQSFFERDITSLPHQVTATDAIPQSNRFLAFVRVPKTATSSIFTLLAGDGEVPNVDCFFAAIPETQARDVKKFPADYFTPFNTMQCEHRSYTDSVKKWGKTILPAVHEHRSATSSLSSSSSAAAASSSSSPSTGKHHLAHKETQQLYTLNAFSIVRDPLDRLVSQFVYMQRIYPNWSAGLRPQQKQALVHDDLTNWIISLGVQGPAHNHQIYQQYRMYMNREDEHSLQQAMELVQGSQPRIFTLVQECFDVSILLLQKQFPEFVRPSRVQAYMESSNEQEKYKNKGMDEMDARVLPDNVRAAALAEWFEKDYRFYNAVVQQFREHVQQAADVIPPDMIQECFQTLDERRKNNQQIVDQWYHRLNT